jgi:ABC-type branched-subunit amino acid transport system ATPase component
VVGPPPGTALPRTGARAAPGARARRAAGEPVVNLPYGLQRRVEIARALATGPSLLLLDEPAAGLTSREQDALVTLIRRIRDAGVTVLVIEHNMRLVMNVCERITVLGHGRVIAAGTPTAVAHDANVIEAYLGSEVRGEAV